MALEPGGYADKLGNRYEGRWVVRQLLLLLNERIRSLTLEAVGDDEQGVDVWVERNNGAREAQQCKAENGSRSHWSLKDLNRRGVLEHLRTQLDRDQRHRFTFVSSSPAPGLRDLSRSARDSAGSAKSFYEDQIRAGSQDRQANFTDWCLLLGVSETTDQGRADAFDLLRRSAFHLFSDTHEERESLRWMAAQAIVGDADAAIAVMADFAVDNLRKTIVASEVWRHLEQAGFQVRNLFADQRIAPRVQQLQADFEGSIKPHLAGGALIHRSEANQVIEKLCSSDPPDVVVLHGAAGHGKSGVLYQLSRKLAEAGTPFLPVRLDRKTPTGSSRKFGEDIGLQESPVHCLRAIASDLHSVLILDQLDALRWTASHATEGLDVCKEMVREALAMRSLGQRMSIVICCRTFDLEHDPQIRAWLKSSKDVKLEKVIVKELAETTVRSFVESQDVNYDRMVPKRQELLRSVQNLAIWAEVVRAEDSSPEFDSGTDLMRQFWANRRREIEKAGFANAERDQLLDGLVQYMESNASLCAPVRLIERNEGLVTQLQTQNIIQVDRRTVTFCHQSYLDYLIADRIVDQLQAGVDSVARWLGEKSKQSLFRREQLRQVLFLLADERPDDCLSAINHLLNCADVRFHIKQLVLEAVGQLQPSPAFVRRMIQLAENEAWRVHVIAEVFHGNAAWIEQFHSQGRLLEWLMGDNEPRRGHALWLIISVAKELPFLMSDALKASAGMDQLRRSLHGLLLYFDAHEEPDDVFEFRLATLDWDGEGPFFDWQKIAKARPKRAIQAVTAIYQCGLKKNSRPRRRLELNDGKDLQALIEVARRHPKGTLRLLVPLLESIAAQKREEQVAWRNRETSIAPVQYPRTKFPRVALQLSRSAIVSLAQTAPASFCGLCCRLDNRPSRAIQALLVRGWAAMPNCYADRAVKWLLAKPSRLRCGSRRRGPRWREAARLIRAISPHCSDQVFERLETVLLSYRDPDEKKRAATWLRWAKEDGDYRNGFLVAQHFLLPALDSSRRRLETTGRIGVLDRKFANYPKDWFRPRRGGGGVVRSPLAREISRVSDKQWLRLLGNQEIPLRDGNWQTRRCLPGEVIESSVEMFAQDLRRAAHTEPERFGKLALKFPKDGSPDYLAAVTSALALSKPSNDVPKECHETWQPASRDCVELFLESIVFPDDTHFIRQFCWLVRDRSDLRPSDKTIKQLIRLTAHSDPEAEKLVINCNKSASEATLHDLETDTLNTVRCIAASALASLLFDNREVLPQVRPSLEDLLDDPHPSVRMAMMTVCLPVWNIDRNLAVDWFLRISEDDLRPAAGRHAQRFFNCAFPEFTDQLSPVVRAMCDSSKDEVAQEGAKEATARWLFFDLFSDLVEACTAGTEAQRVGVAKVVSTFVKKPEYAEKCWPLLIDLCDDESNKVRDEASSALSSYRTLVIPASLEPVKACLKTQAFDDDPTDMLRAFHDMPESLLPYSDLVIDTVSQAIKAILKPNAESDRRLGPYDLFLNPVLFRLYEQAEGGANQATRNRCLDMIDQLLENRMTQAKRLIEQTRE
ncbi:MAG: hypothetical protein AAGG48_26945 [Planctomycetota bacterium]